MRIRAALEAFDRAGVDPALDAVDHILTYTFGETRPCQFNHAVSRATALADHSADPELATWKRRLGHGRPHPAVPLFPGNSHGRRGRPAIRRTLQALDAPASLWEDPPDTEIGTGDSADGRTLLQRLTAWNLWLQRRHETKHPASIGH